MLKCTSAPTVAYPPSQVRTCEVGINHNIVDLNTRYVINLEEGQFLYQKAQKKFWAPGENQTHNPLSSSLDAPTTEPLEALRQTELKFNYYYKDSDVFFPHFLLVSISDLNMADP